MRAVTKLTRSGWLAAGLMAAALVVALVVVPAAAATARSAGPAAPSASTVTDYWEQTHRVVHLGHAGSVEVTIMTLKLPAGNWVLHADQTMVNFGPSDFAGCSIGDTANNNLNTHRTIVGDPHAAGAAGPAGWATVLSETAAVSLSAPTTISVLCEHDTASGASTYIDPNADLWAHRSAHLVIRQLR